MASTKNRPGKPIIKADTPYKSPSIPELSKEQNTIILGLLSSLLEPVGRHRAAHMVKSSGKKSKKRKRSTEPIEIPAVRSVPVEPEISKHLTVGLNSTTRHLEAEAVLSRPVSLPGAENKEKVANDTAGKHLAAIILPKPKDELVYAHLPLMCYTSSAALKEHARPTRLVVLDPSSERTIAAAMGLPRAGVVGVFSDAPGAAPLLDYVWENVSHIGVPWLEKANHGKWLGLSVESRVPGQA